MYSSCVQEYSHVNIHSWSNNYSQSGFHEVTYHEIILQRKLFILPKTMKREGYVFFRQTKWRHSWSCHYSIDMVCDTVRLVSQYGMQILYVYPYLPRRRDAFLTACAQAVVFAACTNLIRSERIRPIILLLQSFCIVFQCVLEHGRQTALARRWAWSICLHRHIGSLPWGIESDNQQEQYVAQFSHYEIYFVLCCKGSKNYAYLHTVLAN